MQINVMCVFRDFCSHVFGRSCQRQVLQVRQTFPEPLDETIRGCFSSGNEIR